MRDSLNFNDGWLISPDPENVGREQGYAAAVRSDALPVPVPGIIQQVLDELLNGIAQTHRKPSLRQRRRLTFFDLQSIPQKPLLFKNIIMNCEL